VSKSTKGHTTRANKGTFRFKKREKERPDEKEKGRGKASSVGHLLNQEKGDSSRPPLQRKGAQKSQTSKRKQNRMKRLPKIARRKLLLNCQKRGVYGTWKWESRGRD